MTTRRLNPEDRKGFARIADQIAREDRQNPHIREPALGTIEERLDIIVRRHGGQTGPVRLTKGEKADYAEWLAWLQENDPTATSPFA